MDGPRTPYRTRGWWRRPVLCRRMQVPTWRMGKRAGAGGASSSAARQAWPGRCCSYVCWPGRRARCKTIGGRRQSEAKQGSVSYVCCSPPTTCAAPAPQPPSVLLAVPARTRSRCIGRSARWDRIGAPYVACGWLASTWLPRSPSVMWPRPGRSRPGRDGTATACFTNHDLA